MVMSWEEDEQQKIMKISLIFMNFYCAFNQMRETSFNLTSGSLWWNHEIIMSFWCAVLEASWQFQFKCEKISHLSRRKFNEIFEKLVKFERIFFHTIKCEPYSLVTWGNLIRKIKTTISLHGAKLLLLWGKNWYFLVDNSLLFRKLL